MRVAYELTDAFVKFVITDQGSGFNPENVPHAAAEADPVAHLSIREKLGLRDGGFGIMISRGMVDEVQYNPAGNQVTLIKRFDRRPQMSPPNNPAREREAEPPRQNSSASA